MGRQGSGPGLGGAHTYMCDGGFRAPPDVELYLEATRTGVHPHHPHRGWIGGPLRDQPDCPGCTRDLHKRVRHRAQDYHDTTAPRWVGPCKHPACRPFEEAVQEAEARGGFPAPHRRFWCAPCGLSHRSGEYQSVPRAPARPQPRPGPAPGRRARSPPPAAAPRPSGGDADGRRTRARRASPARAPARAPSPAPRAPGRGRTRRRRAASPAPAAACTGFDPPGARPRARTPAPRPVPAAPARAAHPRAHSCPRPCCAEHRYPRGVIAWEEVERRWPLFLHEVRKYTWQSIFARKREKNLAGGKYTAQNGRDWKAHVENLVAQGYRVQGSPASATLRVTHPNRKGLSNLVPFDLEEALRDRQGGVCAGDGVSPCTHGHGGKPVELERGVTHVHHPVARAGPHARRGPRGHCGPNCLWNAVWVCVKCHRGRHRHRL